MFRLAAQKHCRPVAFVARHFSSVSNQRKRLDVAIVGLPNAGKSQLLNVLTESSVAAVSRKRHTTRDGILGARTVDNTQLVFVDTPGFLTTTRAKQEGLERKLMTAAIKEMKHVDYTLLVVDAARTMTNEVKASIVDLMFAAMEAQGRRETPSVDQLLAAGEEKDNEEENDDDPDQSRENEAETTDEEASGEASSSSSSSDEEEGVEEDDSSSDDDDLEIFERDKFSVVLNKVDLVFPKSDLLDIAEGISDLAEECIKYCAEQSNQTLDEQTLEEFMPTFFYISAKKKDGVEDVLQFLLEKATPCQSWEVEPGQSSTMTPEERVEEIIREKIYRCLHKEVPYNIQQQNKLFHVGRDKDGKLGVAIQQYLVVRTPSHRDILFGAGGKTLQRIHETAQASIAKLFGCKVTLHLHVKLLKRRQRNWSI